MIDTGVMPKTSGRWYTGTRNRMGRTTFVVGLLLTVSNPSAVHSQTQTTSDPQTTAAAEATPDGTKKAAPAGVDPANFLSSGTTSTSDSATVHSSRGPAFHASRPRRKAKRPPKPVTIAAPSTPDPAPSAPQADGTGGGVIAVTLLLAIIGMGVMLSRKSVGRPPPAATPKHPPDSATVPRSQAASSPAAERPISLKSSTGWKPPGASVTVAGHVVPDGMIYIGKASPYQSDGTGCVVDPELTVSVPSASNTPERLGYWPSYANISPTCRGTYLRWLATGKCDPETEIGYVFLYFYGLERRLLTDQPSQDEVEILVAEVHRLRVIYAGNGSFNGYSKRLIERVELARATINPMSARPYTPDLSLPAGVMSLPLKIAIARKVVAGEPLGFELAAAGLMGLPWDVAPRNTIVVDRARSAFLRSLRIRFEKEFPQGFKLRDRKDSRLRLDYHPASAGLRVNLGSGAMPERLPDPTTLTWTKLVNLAAEVSNELEPYAKMLAYHPERADSLAALTVCPPSVLAHTAIQAQAWLDGLSTPVAVTSFADLARHAIGAAGTKWTLRHHRLVAEVLENVGRGLEPDPRDGAERLDDSTEVLVISDPGCTAPRSPGFGVAAAAAILVAAVARTREPEGHYVEQAWLDRIHSRLNLTSGEILRLSARLVWLRRANDGLAKAKRLLSGATAEQRETVAWSAAIAAAACGIVGKPEVAALENIYDKLEVPRGGLYTTIHSTVAASVVPSIEPVTVSTELVPTTYSIPPPPKAAQSGFDKERLKRVRQETERVSSVLADIFAEEVEDNPDHTAPEVDAAEPFPGLDGDCAAFLKVLATKLSWSRAAFELAAREADLMPDGALEAINEWAFEHFDEPIIEDGDPLTLNASLLGRLTV